jgi:hypoxanthine phosphoribosyltransferase
MSDTIYFSPPQLSDLPLILTGAREIAEWMVATDFLPPRIFALGRVGAQLAPNVVEFLPVKPRLIYLSREFGYTNNDRNTVVSSEGLDPNAWLQKALVVTGLVHSGQTWCEAEDHLTRDLAIRDVRCATLWQGPSPLTEADFVFEQIEVTQDTLERLWVYRLNPPDWLTPEAAAIWRKKYQA